MVDVVLCSNKLTIRLLKQMRGRENDGTCIKSKELKRLPVPEQSVELDWTAAAKKSHIMCGRKFTGSLPK